MSGTFPSTVEPESAEIKSDDGSVYEEMIGGQTDGRQIADQKWLISLRFSRLSQIQWADLSVFLLQQRGSAETFDIVIPGLSENKGTATTASTNATTGSAAVGDTDVDITMTGTLLKGSFFKFDNHDKVYLVAADRSGDGNLTFYPPLATAVSNSQAMTIDNVPFKVRNKSRIQPFSHPQYDNFNYRLELTEAI